MLKSAVGDYNILKDIWKKIKKPPKRTWLKKEIARTTGSRGVIYAFDV